MKVATHRVVTHRTQRFGGDLRKLRSFQLVEVATTIADKEEKEEGKQYLYEVRVVSIHMRAK